MFVDLLTADPICLAMAQEVLQGWKEEHSRYYARNLRYTYAPADYTHSSYSRSSWGTVCGYKPIPGGGRWTTSGGNYTAISITGDSVRITYSGRRHGIRQEVAELLRAAWSHSECERLMYATREPEWTPYDTKDTRQEALAQ